MLTVRGHVPRRCRLPPAACHDGQLKCRLAGGAEYLKYDNCGEVDLQSYAKFSAMSDALNATGKHIVFSYEPHLTVPIQWTQ